ncbi:MAG: MBOAT family protein, partial [Pseudomonadota bacterium]|nr:MBOAT family protein [Pseudomonadota bacterium]
NLLLLVFFKYAGFAAANLEYLCHWHLPHPDILLPIGISFFTFQQIAYLSDCHAGTVREYSFINYGLFVTFFPHLIAGPIVHHREMMGQYEQLAYRPFSSEKFALGLFLFSIGLLKKTGLADNLAALSDPIFALSTHAQALDIYSAWLAAIGFSFQIYFDFSGYSDMAIGLALLFGIHFPMNFNSPYQAASIINFWHRWHMTLSRWLKDYLYIPLGGNRRGPVRRYANLLITMLLGGLWHGANWTFVLWGGLHGIYLLLNHTWKATFRPLLPAAVITTKTYKVFCWAVTMLAVVTAWVLFRAENLSSAGVILHGMFAGDHIVVPPNLHGWLGKILAPQHMAWVHLDTEAHIYGGVWHLALLAGCFFICVFLPNSQRLLAAYKPTLEQLSEGYQVARSRLAKFFSLGFVPGAVCGFVVLGTVIHQILSHTEIPAFIYFKF